VRPIVVVGNVVLDVTVDVDLPSLPVGRQTPAPVGLQAGGGLPNVGGLLEAMGKPVLAVGAVGDDAAGRLVRQLLPWELVSVPGATTEVSVIATGGDRTIINSEGTATVPGSWFASQLPESGVALFGYLNCCSLAVADVPGAVRAARRANCTVVGGLNGVFTEERRSVVADVLDEVDLLVLNEAEALWLAGTATLEAACGAFGSRSSRTCITLGPDGALLIDQGRVRRWRTKAITNGRTLGAGDAFLSGVVAAVTEDAGWVAACEHGVSAARAWVARDQL
jgi:sugar/nucleoside kinase (ribokinase family)